MDTEAYAAARKEQWELTDTLARRSRLSGADADELARLYHATSRDLSVMRTHAPDPQSVGQLSILLARARVRLTETDNFSLTAVARFFVVVLPLAFYRVRWWTLIAAGLFVIIAVASGVAFYQTPALQSQMGTPSMLKHYAYQDFTDYYTVFPSSDFAARVWTNNSWVAALCVATGITGVGPLYILYQNAKGVGQAGAVLTMFDRTDVFFLSILPHGLLELTAIFVACGAGLALFWAWVSPGTITRMESLGRAGRTLALVAVGLVFVLGISGVIEGFVTGSDLPSAVKIGIGALALAAYWAYTLILGSRAARAGKSGDLSEDDAGYRQLEGPLLQR